MKTNILVASTVNTLGGFYIGGRLVRDGFSTMGTLMIVAAFIIGFAIVSLGAPKQ